VTAPLATNGTTGTLSITYVSKTVGATAQVVFDVTGYYTKLDPTAQGATYIPVVPNRLIDSRSPGQLTKLVAGHAQTFTVTNESLAHPTWNIPADAIAVTGNLTVTAQTAPGYFALTQTPDNAPGTSTLNFPLGDDRANGVTAPLATNGTTGTLSITYVSKTVGATAQVVFDVTGYFVPPPG
jgi:hypothetical protein